jgi:predicted component of type VI protein secretion system
MKLVCCLAALLVSFKAIALSDTELARFSQDFLQCLVAARQARQVLSEVSSDGEPVVQSLNAMTAYRRAIAKLERADALMAPYKESSHTIVAETASSVLGSRGISLPVECLHSESAAGGETR